MFMYQPLRGFPKVVMLGHQFRWEGNMTGSGFEVELKGKFDHPQGAPVSSPGELVWDR